MHVRWGRKRGDIDQEITEYLPGRRLGWKHLEERLDGKPAPRISSEVTTMIELHPEGAGTRVVLRSRNVPAGIVGALIAPDHRRAAHSEGVRSSARDAGGERRGLIFASAPVTGR